MNEQFANALIDAELRRLQELSYAGRSALIGKVETKELVGEDGKTYQLELQAFWDSKKGGDIRLMVAVAGKSTSRRFRRRSRLPAPSAAESFSLLKSGE